MTSTSNDVGRPDGVLTLLRDKISLTSVPFTERGSHIMVFATSDRHALYIRLAERWVRREQEVGNYRVRLPIVSDLHVSGDDGAPLPLQWVTYPDHVEMVAINDPSHNPSQMWRGPT